MASAWPASAQRPLQEVLDLNREAMEHFTNLEIIEAEEKLQRAIQIATRGRITGAPLARTYMNLAVVHVGGSDNARGLDAFVRALEADPSAELDPLTSTPDVRTVFDLARRRAGLSGRRPPNDPDVRVPPDGPGNIPHDPVPEQLAQTAVPVFVEAPTDEGSVESVYLYYRGTGMRDMRRVQMEPMSGGFGFEIPCTDVFEPEMQYYIVAFSDDGSPVGFAGTADDPIEVPIVSTRSTPPPSLPGQVPPEPCGDEECPPGMPGCTGSDRRGGMGDSCRNPSDCRAGLTCEDDLCVTGDGDDPDPPPDGDVPLFFLHAGVGLTFGYVTSGMAADGTPPTDGSDRSAWIDDDGIQCDVDGDGSPTPSVYCARVVSAGFVPTFAIRLTAGYYFTDRIAAAATIRFQPSAGEGAFSSLLLGARVQYLITDPVVEGFTAAAYLGTAFGQIQLQPDQGAGVEGPFVISGLQSIQVGSALSYRFAEMVGVHVTPEVHVLFPTFLFAIELTLGLELAL